MPNPDFQSQCATLAKLIREDAWMMDLLTVARSANCREWCLAAGFVRSKAWDHLHGFAERTPCADLDFVFFDRDHPEPEYEQRKERELREKAPHVEWEVVNQATIHTYNDMPPYGNTEEALACWTETATSVGAFLTKTGEIEIVAPHGLDDLFNLIVRPNFRLPRAREIYERRMKEKNWISRWPRLKFVPAGTP